MGQQKQQVGPRGSPARREEVKPDLRARQGPLVSGRRGGGLACALDRDPTAARRPRRPDPKRAAETTGGGCPSGGAPELSPQGAAERLRKRDKAKEGQRDAANGLPPTAEAGDGRSRALDGELRPVT